MKSPKSRSRSTLGDLTANFSRREFKCPCCGRDDISIELVRKLQRVRDVAGPLRITSGVRCSSHNKAVSGKSSSSHLKGLAVDVHCKSSSKRFAILEAAFKVGFRRIGPGPGFVHLDIDEDKAQRVSWDYYKKIPLHLRLVKPKGW